MILADKQAERVVAEAEALRGLGHDVRGVPLDVADFESVRRVSDDVWQQEGRLDYLFNNAGVAMPGRVEDFELGDWQHIVNVNLMGVIHLIQANYRRMTEQRRGHIVNTASVAGLLPAPGNTAYGTTKHAVVGLSTSLRGEAQRYGVRVSVLCPGFVQTDILDGGGKFGRFVGDYNDAQLQHVRRMIESFKPMPVSQFAEQAFKQIEKNRPIIVIPGNMKLVAMLVALLPGPALENSAKMYAKAQTAIEALKDE